MKQERLKEILESQTFWGSFSCSSEEDHEIRKFWLDLPFNTSWSGALWYMVNGITEKEKKELSIKRPLSQNLREKQLLLQPNE